MKEFFLSFVQGEYFDRTKSQTMLALMILSFPLALQVKRKTDWLCSGLFLWSLLTGISYLWWQVEHETLTEYANCAIGVTKTLLVIVTVTFSVMSLSTKSLGHALTFFAHFCLFDSVLMLLNHGNGVMLNQSMDASFVACLMPLFFRRISTWTLLATVPILAVLLSGSSTGLIVAALSVFSLLRSKKSLFVSLIVAVCLLPFVSLNHSILNSNGRVELWKETWVYFKSFGKWWAGFGPGTFIHYEQRIRTFQDSSRVWQAFRWPHNEWIKIGFELGITGLILSLCIWLKSLKNSWMSPWLFSSVLAMGVAITTQPIMAHVIVDVYAALLIKESFCKSETPLTHRAA